MYSTSYFVKAFKQHLIYFLRRLNIIPRSIDYDKFIIITRSRTGSTLLIHYLDNHKNIVCKGELFQYLYKPVRKQWNAIWQPQNLNTEIMGFKLFYNHPINGEHNKVLEFIKEEKKIKIIHLIRKNLLEIAASQVLAEKTGEYAFTKKNRMNKTLEIPVEKCTKTFEYTESGIKATRALFGRYDYLEVFYEDLDKSPTDTLNTIFKFLNVEPHTVFAKVKKQNNLSMEQKITNYQELKNYFMNTAYNKYFK